MKRIWMSSVAAATGGLLAGILLGIIEAISLSILGGGWVGFAALFWSIAAYGVLGFLGGLALGLAGSVLLGQWLPQHANWWLLVSSALILCGPGLIVMRFRLVRDLLQERVSLLSLESVILHGVLVFVLGGLLAITWLVGRRWFVAGSEQRDAARPSPEAMVLSAAALPSAAATADGADLSRRRFLKASLAAGLVTLPAAAAASRMLDRSPSFAAVHLSDRMNAALRDKPNVIVIVADTLRADHLGAYGYAKAVTPQLDDFAAHSTRFANMFSQAAWTKPSMATLLTALYPSTHTARYKTSALPANVVTLPEVLQSRGYVTGGFANNVNIAPFFNFHQGYTDYEFLEPDYLFGASEASSQLTIYQTARMLNERFLTAGKNVHNFYQPADVVNERALGWLQARRDNRFFLFLHYMEPHDPYFEHPFNHYGIARVSTPNPPPELAPEMIRLYDQEITYMDQHLGELFSWLKKQGLYDETLIVFTADHGEEFYEHGGWWHGLTLYDEQIHVPLLIKMPGQTTGTVDADLARTLDIAPTVLRAVGFDKPETMQGVDLRGDPEKRPKFVFAEEDHQGNVLRAGRNANWKVMEANAGNPRGLATRTLFNLADDPGEQRNLSDAEPDTLAMASERVAQVSDWAKSHALAASEVTLDLARQNAIEKSGYGR